MYLFQALYFDTLQQRKRESLNLLLHTQANVCAPTLLQRKYQMLVKRIFWVILNVKKRQAPKGNTSNGTIGNGQMLHNLHYKLLNNNKSLNIAIFCKLKGLCSAQSILRTFQAWD